MKPGSSNATIFLAAVIGCLVLLNILGLRTFGRFDATRDELYTLAQASKDTMAGLEEPVTVTAYFTDDLPPPYSSNARYVRDLLEEFRAASKGRPWAPCWRRTASSWVTNWWRMSSRLS